MSVLDPGGVYLLVGHDGSDTSPTAMAHRARQVMPFDLNRTTHTFTKIADGGIQKVIVKHPGDTRNRDLIRVHLRSEARTSAAATTRTPARSTA